MDTEHPVVIPAKQPPGAPTAGRGGRAALVVVVNSELPHHPLGRAQVAGPALVLKNLVVLGWR